MKLDYSILISPYPLFLNNIGHIKSITLEEIFSPSVTYLVYNSYLSFLLLTPETYYEEIAKSKTAWYNSLPQEKKDEITTFDLVCKDVSLQKTYQSIFNLFLVENVVWDNINQVFVVYTDFDDNGNVVPIGLIHKNIFGELCDIILQRCAINRSAEDVDESQVKSKKARKTIGLLKKGRKKLHKTSERNRSVEIPNLISSLASRSKSLNYINIWKLTVYQLYDQFKREQTGEFLDIQKTSVAAYGNKEKNYKGNEWYAYQADAG